MAKEGIKSWKLLVTWIARIIMGTVFIFSGFAKAVDPWGTVYKIADYVGAMGMSLPETLYIFASYTLCALEFLLGIFLLFGCFRKGTPIATTLFMAVMLVITLWVAIKDPVADCGCFGDALVIGNWETFFKNVVLTALAIWLIPMQRRSHWLITPALQWICFVASGTFILAIEFIGYNYQPLVDFRQYKVGQPLIETESANDRAESVFIYEKDGVRKEFSINDIPDEAEGWQFVDRKDNSSTDSRNDKNLRIYTRDNDPDFPSEDVTEEVLDGEGDRIIIFFPDIDHITIAPAFKINSFYDWATSHDIDFVAVASGSDKKIEEWQDLSMSEYPIYIADDTQIKEVVRGNPAVVFTRDGNIMWKSSLLAIPHNDFMRSDETIDNPMLLARDNARILRRWLFSYVAFMAILVLMSYTPGFWSAIRNKIKQKKEKLLRNGNSAADNRENDD